MKLRLLPVLLMVCTNAFAQGSYQLIAHWNFNGSANDVSGNGISWHTEYSISINGTGDHIDVPYQPIMNIDSTFTICAVIKPTGFYPGDCQGNFILTRGAEYSSVYYMLGYDDGAYDHSCGVATPDHQVFYSSVPGNYLPPWYPGNTLIVPNTWYCVVLSYTGDTINLYVDGTRVISMAMHKTYSTGTDGIGIGYNPTRVADFPYWINGAIDDIRLYNRGLSDAEALAYCDSATNPLLVSHETTSAADITLYPNPANSELTITSSEGITSVTIINTMGHVLLSKNASGNKANIPLSSLPAGIYFARINSVTVRKFIKQ